MKETEWTFKIPDLIKKQINMELDACINITYSNFNHKVEKEIQFTLTTCDKYGDREALDFEWVSGDDQPMSFEDYFNYLRRAYKFVGDENE